MGGTYQESAADGYEVRPYRPSDREGFLSLYETVWGRRKEADWFAWRFEANPYGDGVQMPVVESDGELVAAEPLLPFRLRIDGTTRDAYQPVDWIVHPDHRRCGLFTRLTETVLDRHLPEVALLFNFPNELLRPGLEKFDWQPVEPVVCRYRVQNSRAFVGEKESKQLPAVASIAARHATPAVRAGLGVIDRLNRPPQDVTVERSAGVPVETVAELYRSTRPDRVHVPRDRQYLRWRFANPNWETTSYVAVLDGEPVASLITATEEMDHCRVTHLLDSQPMAREAARPAAFEALLAAAVADSGESDLLRMPSGYYPSVCRRYGFLRDDAFPLSLVSTRTTHAIRTGTKTRIGTGAGTEMVRETGGGAGGEEETDLTDPDAWRLSLVDLDIE